MKQNFIHIDTGYQNSNTASLYRRRSILMFCDTFRSKFGFDISDEFLHVLHPDAYFNIDGNISDHIESIKKSIMNSIAHSIREKRKSKKSFEHSLLTKISNMKPSGPNSRSSIESAKIRLQHMEQPS